ncbi:major capsid protein [Streptomyces sp. NPDC001282]|uniref:major capsid protein n=1 Tax=Streptomyces sp. NPDC001282 TaxID=3364557 RepID=UPI0036BB077D
MDLTEVLAALREIDTSLTEEEQAETRKGTLTDLLSSGHVDMTALTAAVREKTGVLDGTDDVTEDQLREISLLADVSDAINARTAFLAEEKAKADRKAAAAALAARINSTEVPTASGAEVISASTTVPPARRSTGASRSSSSASYLNRFNLVASSDLPGHYSGTNIPSFAALSAAITERAGRASARVTDKGIQLASLQRVVPETHHVAEQAADWHKIDTVANEHAQFGQSLAATLLKRSQSLTASTPIPGLSTGYAWCAPMEIRDELCPVEGSLDGLLDLPTLVTSRGGVMWPTTPDYTALYTPFCFSDGDMNQGYDLEKPCVELPCPEGWDEAKLEGCSYCLQTGIVQSRVAPEQVERAVTELLIAHQHHLNGQRIQKIVDSIASESGAHTDLSEYGNHGPGLIESFLSFIELQAHRIRERRRLAFTTTLEAVFPLWVLSVLRADLTKKNAIEGRWAATDQDVINYLLLRGIRPQFVRGWQDEWLREDVAVTQYPTSMTFLLFQAGTFVNIVGPSVQLEMVHDKALIQANKEIRLFAEDLYAIARRCGQAASFTVPLCANGVSGGQVVADCTPFVPTPAPEQLRVAPRRR